jgi:transcriptional regulator with XRE-family HTH domain
MEVTMDFGSFVRMRRLELDHSLRKFALLMEMDASRWSKIERGQLPFPEEVSKFEKLTENLQISHNSTEWYNLRDLVSISRRTIPEYVYEDKEILKALPIFFRTAQSGDRPTDEELNDIIRILKER